MSRWLLIFGGLVVMLLVALVVILRSDGPKAASIDARVATIRTDANASTVRDARVEGAHTGDASKDHSAHDEREALLAGLRDSGSGAESWDSQGTTLLASLAGGGVVIRDATCYVAGCSATFTFPSEREYRRRLAELEASDAYRAWTGGKRFSPTVLQPDGQLVVALLLYRPD